MILFLAANPIGTDRLALDREARSIRAELKRSGYRDRFDFETRWAAEPLDLLREVRELKPTVLHFSGHGGAPAAGRRRSAHDRDVVAASEPVDGEPDGLYFQDAAGGAQVVSAEAIAQTLGATGASVRLVVLNACFTELIAEALLVHIECVVGMGGSIHDDAARSFALGFYGGLGEHESIAAAFEHGRAAVRLEGLSDGDRPRLKVRDGFDAAGLVLAAVAPAIRLAPRCPYPGMQPYAADDAAVFHGRDAEIHEVLGRLRAGERELYVIGPSGSGKSSLVRAGVLPRLARGVAGLGPFVVRDLRPGDQPATRLRQALEVPPGEPLIAADRIAALLAHRGAGSSVLIVIDQLEELFTLASPREGELFLAGLRELRTERRCVVLFTLRADFFGALMESPLWVEPRGQLSRIEVSSLRGAALRDAISASARDVGVVVEPDLLERLLADAASEPGILPLVQETMVQLWEEHVDETLTLADYQALGDGERSGLAVSLARRADATVRRFTPAQTVIARRILLRLVSFGEGRPDTRRQQPMSRLRAAAPDPAADFAYVLQQMIDHRLLTIDEDDRGGDPRVDLGHEVMITAWPTLASWIRSHRANEQRRRQLEAAAAQWVEHGRGVRGLLDPLELADAEVWQQTESALHLGHGAEVLALTSASSAAHTRQRRRRRGLIGGAFATLATFAVVVGLLAITARDEASRARNEASKAEASNRKNQQLLAQSYEDAGRQLLVEGHPQEAVPYLVAARQNGGHGAPLRMMFWAATRHLPLVPALEHHAAVRSAVFSPDGTRVVTTSLDKTARIWNATTGEPLTRPLEHPSEVTSAAFSPDGTRVVTAAMDHAARVWNAATGEPLASPLAHRATVWRAAFSPDGRRLVTASADHTARIWDVATGKPLAGPLEHQAAVWSAAFSPDGRRIVTASWDKTAQVWDAATGKPITRPLEHQATVWSAAFSPDGTLVVTASADKTARVWDAATGRLIAGPLEHQEAVWSAAFSPDGRRVVTASLDKTSRVWDAATGQPVTGALVHGAWVVSAAFSPDGTRVVTASWDKTARIWDVASGTPRSTPLEHQDAVWSAQFSPDGTRVVTASVDKTARIWNAAVGRPPSRLLDPGAARWSFVLSPNSPRVVSSSKDRTARVWAAAMVSPLASILEHRDEVSSAAFSPDSSRVVTASTDHTARVWDAATGQPLTRALEHQGTVKRSTFSPDGTRVVTASFDHTARIWDAATGAAVARPLEHRGEVKSAVFSPDGTRVVTASADKTARIWDAATGTPVTGPLEHQAEVRSAAFSPDGTRVVTASTDQTARVWDAATGTPVTGALSHQAAVWRAAFSPDGTRVVTASADKTARIWDATTGQLVTGPLQHQGDVITAVFSPDGSRVATASWDHTARVWDAVTGKPATSPLEHEDHVRSAAFSSDGTRVVTASSDHTARIWDAVTGKLLIRPLEHQGHLLSAVFSPDDARVVSAGSDNTARVWDVRLDDGTLEQWLAIAERSPFVLSGIAHMPRSAKRTLRP